MAGFRQSVGRCELCLAEVGSAQLEPVAGLAVCPACRGGELERALAARAIKETHRRHEFHSPSGGGGWRCQVELDLAVRPELIASLRAQSKAGGWFNRLLGRGDPEVGLEEFDQRVTIEVESEHRDALFTLLEQPEARQAVLWIVGQGCSVSFCYSVVVVAIEVWAKSSLPELDQMRLYALVLAVVLQRTLGRATA